MYSMVFTVNKRSVMVLCDDYSIDEHGLMLWSHDPDLVSSMEISRNDIDSFFVVNEFEPTRNTIKMIPKTWFNLEELIESQRCTHGLH